ELSPINPYADTTSHDGKPWSQLDVVRPWESLTTDEKRLFRRMAEVYAGFLSHADHELGRLLDYLDESGQLENTIVVLVSDSLASSFDDAHAETQKETQFYSMLGTRAIWHKGWKAATAVPAAPESWGDFHLQRWELFDTTNDPSECNDLSEKHPEKLQELIDL